jgi:hypothetical protein
MKRAKATRDDTRSLESRTPPKIIRDLHVVTEVQGEQELSPLCISGDGTRMWARVRPPPHSIVFRDINAINSKWEKTNPDVSAGPWGFTTCDATGAFFAMQRRQDGMWVVTDGGKNHKQTYLEFNMDKTAILKKDTAPSNPSEAPAARAVSCIPNIGLCAVIDDIGLVFLPMFTDRSPSISHASEKLESTLCTEGVMAFVVEENVILGIDLRQEQQTVRVPIPGLSDGERVWNLSVAGPLMSVCTVFRDYDISNQGHPKVMWLVCKEGSMGWATSEMTGVVAVNVSGEHGLMAIVTALGDLVILDVLGRTDPKRLVEGSEGVPFISQHTRDGIVAWGGNPFGNRCVRMIKPGGAVSTVVV